MSRLSLIRDTEPESTIKLNSTLAATNLAETLEIVNEPPATSALLPPLPPSVSNSSLSQMESGTSGSRFVRGEPSTRLSTNLRRMFKSVIEHQTSALQTLEKFYECQIGRIEIERAEMLSITPDEQKARVSKLYDQQLQALEQRVQTNLKRLLDNKTGFQSKPPVPNSSTQHFNRMAQFLLIKQLQMQQQQQQKTSHRAQGRTRTLSGVKASLVSTNQTGVLPPRMTSVPRRCPTASTDEAESTESSGDELGNGSLRRNLSLPFKQPRCQVTINFLFFQLNFNQYLIIYTFGMNKEQKKIFCIELDQNLYFSLEKSITNL